MQRAFKKIIEKLMDKSFEYDNKANDEMIENGHTLDFEHYSGRKAAYEDAIKIVNQVALKYDGGWIPVSERLPEVETEVLIYARRKYKGGGYKDIITTAMYEDGTVRDDDSSWAWEDLDGEWDEEADCMIIPEGWWENKHYNPDGVLNYGVDDDVVAWQPLPEAYQMNGEERENELLD